VSAHLQRFSTFAATSVALLIASGAVNGLSQIPVPEAMLDTAYGRALTVKLCLMMALLAVAGVNAAYLRPRLTSGAAPSERLRPLLTRTTAVEIGMAVIVLLVAAVLVQYPTSRQVRAAAANVESSAQAVVGFEEVQPAGDVSVDLSIAPNRVGTNSYRIFLFPASGGQIGEVQRVRLRFKPPDPTVGPSEIIAEQSGVSAYKAVGSFFAQPGRWEVQVDLRRAQVEDVTAIFRVDVTGAAAQAGGGRYAYPLEVGSWLGVGAVGALLAALLMAVWGIQWPSLAAPAPRLLRVGSAAIAVVGLGVLFGVVWGLAPQKSASGNPIAPTGDSIAIGRSLFATKCATCHGPSGHGDGPQAPALEVPPADFRQHVPYHSDEFFFQVISNGLGTFMPPFAAQLSAEERWHLINFLKSEFGQNAEQAGQP
ncbi:MAG TPA: CopD family protein, partial [Dehalococcoidia bacterium]|nr:CopD family protein [Dehalococcoidia bacterium]